MSKEVAFKNRDRFIQLGIAIATLRKLQSIAGAIKSENSVDGVYKIEYGFTLLENNNVGNKWRKSVFVNSEKFESGEIIPVKDAEIKIYVSESDKIPDQNSRTIIFTYY